MSMKPNAKPQKTKAEWLKLLPEVKAKVFLAAIRGYYLDSMGAKGKNDRGVYDDAVGVFWPDGFAAFNFNTDPSGFRKGSGTGSSKGMACLKAGVWSYKKGKHGYNRGNPYSAFVQNKKVTVVRDGSPNYEDTGFFGINIHRGGDGTTSSLGCQTVPPEQWLTFQQLVYNLMDQFGQTELPYVVIENTPEINSGKKPTEPATPIPVIGEQGTYTKLFLTAILQRISSVDSAAKRVLSGKSRYEAVAGPMNIPWWMVGVIHYMEGSCNFKTHLHNGDSLNARTVHVPAGRPKMGEPPFKWEDSALDALAYDRVKNLKTLEDQLYFLERYNGMGYKNRGIKSPYLWGCTQHYVKGRYPSDGKFDPEGVQTRPGCAAILKRLVELGAAEVKIS